MMIITTMTIINYCLSLSLLLLELSYHYYDNQFHVIGIIINTAVNTVLVIIIIYIYISLYIYRCCSNHYNNY